VSEFQLYEFQTIDRRLTRQEMAEISQLSSRVELTATLARFTYDWGDFRGDEEAVLEQYFDAMLYITNWGSRRLMFRYPQAMIPLALIAPYLTPMIAVRTTTEHTVIDMSFDSDNGEWHDMDYDPDDLLTELIDLREAILQGDYRALYIVWLSQLPKKLDNNDDDFYDDDELPVTAETREPPVPPGLAQLDDSLIALIDFFGVDLDLVTAAAMNSPAPQKSAEAPLEKWLDQLSDAERKDYLRRVMRGEANVGEKINRELRQRFGSAPAPVIAVNLRTVGELYELTSEVKRRVAAAKLIADTQARQTRLTAMAKKFKAGDGWADVIAQIERRNASGYKEAVRLMTDLREVAEFEHTLPAYKMQIDTIRTRFSTLRTLLSHMQEAGLLR